MSICEETLRGALKTAMLEKDSLRVRVLRSLLAAVKNRAIEARGKTLTEADLVAVIKREAKQCRETLEFARKADRKETVREQEAVLAVLESYLPAQMDEEALRREVEVIAAETGADNIGPVMKELSARHGGRFDGRMASRIAAEIVGRKKP